MSTSTPKSGQLNFLLDKKQCPGCKKVLPVTEFYVSKWRRDGRRSICKSCEISKQKKRRKNNLQIHAIRDVYYQIKQRARKKNIPMEITFNHLKSMYPGNMICPVLGIKMESGRKNFYVDSPSVDRIVPEKGYVPGNIIVVSMKANQIKSNATPDEIIKVGTFYKKLLEEMEDGSETD